MQGSSDEFRREQRSDKTLQAYWTRAEAGSNEFKVINGLLYRKISNGVNETQEYALVVPEKYRKELLTLAHDYPTSGHQGVRKKRHV